MNETIRINIDIDNRPIRDLERAINDLRNTLQGLSGELSSSGSTFNGLESAIGITLGTLALFGTSTRQTKKHLTTFTDNLTTAKIATGAFKGAIGLFGIALKALPVVAVVGALGWLANALFSSRNASNEAEEALQSLSEELEANRRAHDQNIQSIQTRNQVTRDAIGTMEKLSDAEYRSVGDKNRLRIATDQVNQSLSDNATRAQGAAVTLERYNAEVGNANEALETHHERISNNISAYTYQAGALEVMEGHLNEIIRYQQDSHETGLLIEELQPAYDAASEAVERYREEMNEINAATMEAYDIYQGFNPELDAAIARYEAAQAELDGVNYYMDQHNMVVANAEERISELEAAYAVAFTEMFMHVQEHGLTLGALNDTQLEVVDRAVGYWERYADLSGEMFRRVGQQNAMSLDEILANQEANAAATEAWQNNLALLYEMYGAEVAQHFSDMGEAGMHTVAEMAAEIEANYRCMTTGTLMSLDDMVEGSESRATQIVNNLESAGELADRGLNTRFADACDYFLSLVGNLGRETNTTLQQDFNAANFAPFGEAIPEGVMEGIERGSIRSLVALAAWADELGLCFETILGINSPSRVFMGYGENIVEGLCKGIEALQDRPTRDLERLATAMERVYTNSSRNYQNIGRDIMRGLNQGLLNGENQVMNTANRIANNIARTMRQALQINSPSRVMREQIGRHIPAGMVQVSPSTPMARSTVSTSLVRI